MKRAYAIVSVLLMLVLAACGGGGATVETTGKSAAIDTTTTIATTATTPSKPTATMATVIVPNLVGMTEAHAVRVLNGLGLHAQFRDVDSEEAPGTVVAQIPTAGSPIPVTSTITGNVSKLTTTTEPPTTTTTTESEAVYKKSCAKVSYKVLSKNPDIHESERYTFRGKIFQIEEDTSATFMLLEITKGSYGIWDDLVMVAWPGTADIYEDDIVTVWGECTGSFDYTTKIGGTNSVPGFHALYVEKAK